MILSSIAQAIGLFIATNIDDIIILSLFFGRGQGQPRTTRRILLGQYLGFLGILGAAVAQSRSRRCTVGKQTSLGLDGGGRDLCQRWRHHWRLRTSVREPQLEHRLGLLHRLPRPRGRPRIPCQVDYVQETNRRSLGTLGRHPVSDSAHWTRHHHPHQQRSLRTIGKSHDAA